MRNGRVAAVLGCRERLGKAFAAYQARGERGDERLQADVDAALRELYDQGHGDGVADGVEQGVAQAVDKMRTMCDSLAENSS